jgi:hypothetical protein
MTQSGHHVISRLADDFRQCVSIGRTKRTMRKYFLPSRVHWWDNVTVCPEKDCCIAPLWRSNFYDDHAWTRFFPMESERKPSLSCLSYQSIDLKTGGEPAEKMSDARNSRE